MPTSTLRSTFIDHDASDNTVIDVADLVASAHVAVRYTISIDHADRLVAPKRLADHAQADQSTSVHAVHRGRLTTRTAKSEHFHEAGARLRWRMLTGIASRCAPSRGGDATARRRANARSADALAGPPRNRLRGGPQPCIAQPSKLHPRAGRVSRSRSRSRLWTVCGGGVVLSVVDG